MNHIKWIFFDIGYTLVDETKAHESRILETIKKNPSITYDEFYSAMMAASKNYLQPYKTALDKFHIPQSRSVAYPKEFEVPYENAGNILKKLQHYYKIGIIANQSPGT